MADPNSNETGPDSGADSPADEVEKVTQPRPCDVLCGRGGMSNHHPGNEWYRRLIKSNRPLYRACPKHTKLLVAKAIVQAVESQNGRFLEKSKGQSYWTPVPYKRSVDKTSQGLRERDREDDNEYDSTSPGPDLNAGGMTVARTLPPQQLQMEQQPYKKPAPADVSPRPAVLPRPTSTANHALRTVAAAPVAKAPPPSAAPQPPPPPQREETLAPLPTQAPTVRDSSMFRFLKQNTKLLSSTENAAPEPQLTPQLTRFSSQVSDWLNSFWPNTSASGGGGESNHRKRPAPPPPPKLEQSVSTILLKMAQSSSNVFDEPSSSWSPSKKSSNPFDTTASSWSPSKKSKLSLLDDYPTLPADETHFAL